MFVPRSPARALLRNMRTATPSRSARISARSYATRPSPNATPSSSTSSADGGMGQTLFIVAASLAVGGVIMSQRGKVTNEASVKAARAVNSEGVGRDKKRVEEPVYTQENVSEPVSVPDIVVKKEEEAEQSTQGEAPASQGAFNEETGEINWDCPCLGGMADGPCGEDFKAAFSCFVYSEAEPKGVDCVEKFKGMQDCFRLHPEIYGEEIEDDEQSNAPGAFDSDAPGEEIVAVDAPPTRAEAVAVDSDVVKAEAAEGAATGTL